jgi:hypothetical protein
MLGCASPLTAQACMQTWAGLAHKVCFMAAFLLWLVPVSLLLFVQDLVHGRVDDVEDGSFASATMRGGPHGAPREEKLQTAPCSLCGASRINARCDELAVTRLAY